MDIIIDITFVCAFYLELIPEWETTFTLIGRDPVRKTLSFSKELRLLQAATALEDALCAPRCAITTKTGNVPLTTASEEKD